MHFALAVGLFFMSPVTIPRSACSCCCLLRGDPPHRRVPLSAGIGAETFYVAGPVHKPHL